MFPDTASNQERLKSPRSRPRSSGDQAALNVALVISNNYPVDRQVRTKKMVKTLDRNGHDVVILARNTTFDPAQGEETAMLGPPTEHLPRAIVRRFSWLASTPLFGLITAAIPLNPAWLAWIAMELTRRDIDVVITGDLRSGLPTAVAGTLLGIPVIFDLREHYQGLARTLPTESVLDLVVRHEGLVGLLERSTIRLADEVWVVVDERKRQLIRDGVPPEKLSVVSNTPDLDTWLAGSQAAEHGGDDTYDWSEFTLVYVGVLNEFRGLDLMIDAVAQLRRTDGEDVHLAIAGEGPHKAALERRCRRLGIDEQVTFTGWIDADRVPAFLSSGDVGVLPHRVTPLTEYTIPNKVFDYMLAGLPVLTTDMTPVRRIVTQANCGRVLPADPTPAEAASLIREFKSGDGQPLGENGRRAVEERYNWSRESERMMESIERLQKGAR